MKLILVHGIHQENKDPDQLKEAWMAAIEKGSNKLRGTWGISEDNIIMPYYGDKLARDTFQITGKVRHDSFRPTSPFAVPEEVIADEEFLNFSAAAMLEMNEAYKSSKLHSEKSSKGEQFRGKSIHKKSLKFAARVVQWLSPLDGKIALRKLAQAHTYLTNVDVQNAVNEILHPHLEGDEEKIVVAHSLGTIVSYDIMLQLHKMDKLHNVRQFITLGSPLSLKIVMDKFKDRSEPISAITKWINGTDKEDFIALGNDVDGDHYQMPIENILDIDNGNDDPHSIERYLEHTDISNRIVS